MQILLISGILSDASINNVLANHLREMGHRVTLMDLQGFHSIGQAVEVIDTNLRGYDEKIVIIGHSAGGQLATRFIDDPRVQYVVGICNPSHTPLDYPWRVWVEQSKPGLFLASLFNRQINLPKSSVVRLFGAEPSTILCAPTRGHFCLQMSMGCLLGNFAPKVKAEGKYLGISCLGDPLVSVNSGAKTARRCHGIHVVINHPNHFPQIGLNNSISAIMAEIGKVIPL